LASDTGPLPSTSSASCFELEMNETPSLRRRRRELIELGTS
jgi:hypothetical protein